MNTKQIKWAAQHDWFIRSINTSKGLVVICKDDMNANNVETFTDFQAMTEWAGY